jgi:hypothetical protein
MITLGEALPLEIARVRDDVMPAYRDIGVSGAFALARMKNALEAAEKATVEGDTVAMLRAYEELKGFNT